MNVSQGAAWREYKILPDRERQRRWFKSSNLDLVVWLHKKSVVRFQLTFLEWIKKDGEKKLLEQHVLTYESETGLVGAIVPEENSPYPTPKILVHEEFQHFCGPLTEQIVGTSGLPEEIGTFVVKILGSGD